MVQSSLQGCVLAVQGDRVVRSSCHGWADADQQAPCTRATRFQIASISKQFTAALTLQLVEQQRASLDDSVTRWISNCPTSWRAITLHHLLSHTSGIGHWFDYSELDLSASIEPDMLLSVFQSRHPLFPPGSRFAYSSPGYVLLAHVVQQLEQRPYQEVIDEKLLTPLGLTGAFVGPAGGRANVAVGYDGATAIASFDLETVSMGTGDVWCTGNDLLRWGKAFRNGRLLRDPSRISMFTPQAQVEEGVAYGYGWYLGSLHGHPARFHPGDNAGFQSFSAWLPDLDLLFVALSNQERTSEEAMMQELAAAVAASSHP
jgi:CubicO group peptidase (beta-lactamase class C family)